jgi:hypothetical protein
MKATSVELKSTLKCADPNCYTAPIVTVFTAYLVQGKPGDVRT